MIGTHVIALLREDTQRSDASMQAAGCTVASRAYPHVCAQLVRLFARGARAARMCCWMVPRTMAVGTPARAWLVCGRPLLFMAA